MESIGRNLSETIHLAVAHSIQSVRVGFLEADYAAKDSLAMHAMLIRHGPFPIGELVYGDVLSLVYVCSRYKDGLITTGVDDSISEDSSVGGRPVLFWHARNIKSK